MAGRVTSPVFIGRRPELTVLEQALLGPATAVLVGGDAGVGKTRLVGEFSSLVGHRGARLLCGGCLDLGEGTLPYVPFVEALRLLLRAEGPERMVELAGTSRPALTSLLPELDDGAGMALGVRGDGLSSAQARLFELVLGMLRRLADDAPTVVVLEDLHWADRSTRDLLAFLVRNLDPSGLLLVGTYRADELHRRHPLRPLLAELSRTRQVVRVDLAPFDDQELSAQLAAILGHRASPELLVRVAERSEGNPFFAEELLVAAGDDGDLPASLRDALLARLTPLSEPAQAVLRVAAAAGRRVPHDLLVAVAGDDPDLLEGLREAVAHQLLLADGGGGTYAFRHALVQEAAYGELLPGERVTLHRRLAEVLQSHPEMAVGGRAAVAAELAHHWYAAHDLPRALTASLEAAAAAEASAAHGEALAHRERALELWGAAAEVTAGLGVDRIDVLASAASDAYLLGELARSLTMAEAVVDALQASGDAPVRLALAAERLGRYLWVAGRGDRALEQLDTAAALLPEGPSLERAHVLASHIQLLMLFGRPADALTLGEEALAVARQVGARREEGHVLATVGVVLALQGHGEEGLGLLVEARHIAEEVGDIDDLLRSYSNLSSVLEVLGRFEEAAGDALAGHQRARAAGLERSYGSFHLANAADALYRLGRWDEADAALVQCAPGATGVVGGHVALSAARLAGAKGQFEAAEARFAQAGEVLAGTVDPQFVGPQHQRRATLARWQDTPAVAFDLARTGLARLPEDLHDIYVAELAVTLVAAAADLAAVPGTVLGADDELVVEATMARLRAAVAATAGCPQPPPEPLAHLATAEAERTRLSGRSDAGLWALAAGAWRALGCRYDEALATWRQAESVLEVEQDRLAADRLLRHAAAIATQLGAVPLLGSLEVTARRAGLTSPAPGTHAAPAAHGLTAREREVLALVAEGRTNRQIAGALFISDKTASVHVSNILAKMGVAGRGEAAAMARREGLA